MSRCDVLFLPESLQVVADAYHLQPVRLDRVECDPPTERIGIRPQPLRKPLADDHDSWRIGRIALGERAAANQPDAHRGEVVGRRDTIVDAHFIARLGQWLPFGVDGRGSPEPAQRQKVRGRRGLDAGE